MHEIRKKEKEKLRRIAAGEPEGHMLEFGLPRADKTRRGNIYRQLLDTGLGERLLAEEISQVAVAQMLGTSNAEVLRALQAIQIEKARAEAMLLWEMAPDVEALFPQHLFDELRVLGVEAERTPEFQVILGELVQAWDDFQARFFTIGAQQEPMVVAPFHREWVAEILLAVTFGLKVLIVAPPRHGKTETLMRVLMWLYIMFPNRQTLWVGSASVLVRNMSSAIKEQFESNVALREAVLPPGGTFVPQRQDPNRPWGANEFTLKTRTAVGLKSPTMTALGSTAKIPGRDVTDLIIDDIEDLDSARDPEQRKKMREKHAEIMERKEGANTFAVTICSRQHPEDIPNYLMEQIDDQAWRILVYSAHADWCDLDPDVVEGHDENGCVLFPQVRPYSWILDRKSEYEALGLPGRFEMRILNQPMPTTGIVFQVPKIKDMCLDETRGTGIDRLPPMRMIAGIDPASRATQAAFAWGWTEDRKYVIDIEEQKAGGFEGAFDLIRRWNDKYGILTFVYEDNSSQVEFFRDPRFYQLKAEIPGLEILPSTTGRNKHDPELGISSMAPDYHNGVISLPYGTPEARKKVNRLLNQLRSWSTDQRAGRQGKTDVKMASWLPWPRMMQWDRDARNQEDRHRIAESDGNPYPMSYPELNSFSTLNRAPW